MAGEASIHVGITQMLLAAASHAGMPRATILAEAGLSERVLANADGRIGLSAHRAVGEAIIRRAAGQNLVALVAEMASPSAFGVVGKLLQNSADLRAALTAMGRYQQLVIDGLRVGFRLDEASAVLVARVPAFIEELHHPLLAVFAVLIVIGRQLTGVSWAPRAVTFNLEAQPGDLRALEPIYGVAPRFGANEHAIHLDPATLRLPIVGARPEREAMFRVYADSLMAELHLEQGLRADVCQALVTSLSDGVTRQDRIAKQLGMSARTLSRRLKQQGTSFGELLDRVRNEMSQQYLRDPSLSVHEVSFLLGYTEPSTFFRAFKRWTGTTPAAWRAVS
ncbi:MAG: AraC family transcriptional regulator [Myxococcales bacterium]|nr:AraC family transcriptional regulator [Myxococcales bacterium]